MAIKPSVVYPGKINTPDVDYPQGSARNITVPGDGLGTPLENTWLNDLFGFEQALLAESGDAPSGTPDTSLVSQYLDGVKAAALNAEFVPVSGPAISISGFLDRQGIWAEDETGIQQANDYLVSGVERGTIRIAPSVPVVLTGPVAIDTEFVNVQGNGAILDATGLLSGQALTLRGLTTPAAGGVGAVIEDLTLLGPGPGVGVTGVGLSNPIGGTNGPSRVVLRNISIDGFLFGKLYGDAAYPIESYSVEVRNCGTGIFIAGTAAAKAPITITGGGVSDCAIAVNLLEAGRTVEMFGALLEDNDQVIAINGGLVDLHGCRLRAADYPATPITIATAGSGVNMFGGALELTDPAPAAFSQWVDAGTGTFFFSRGTRFNNTLTTGGGAFATGTGTVKIRESHYDDPATEVRYIESAAHKLKDGRFNSLTIEDDIYITKATAAIVDRHTAGTTDLLIDITDSQGGANSLRYNKAVGSGPADASAFALVSVPVGPFDRMGGFFYWKKGLGDAGSFDVNYKFVKLGVNALGIPNTQASETVETVNHVVANPADVAWTLELLPQTVNMAAPPWATHFVIEIDGGLMDGTVASAGINFDTMVIDVVG